MGENKLPGPTEAIPAMEELTEDLIAKLSPGALKRVLVELRQEDGNPASAAHDSYVRHGSYGRHNSHGKHTSHSKSK